MELQQDMFGASPERRNTTASERPRASAKNTATAAEALVAFKQGLAELLGPDVFKAWADAIVLGAVERERVVIGAPTPLHVERLLDKVGPRRLAGLWSRVDPEGRRMTIEPVGPAPLTGPYAAPAASGAEPSAGRALSYTPVAETPDDAVAPEPGFSDTGVSESGLSDSGVSDLNLSNACPSDPGSADVGMSFDGFVVGEANKVAFAFTRAVAESEEPPARLGFIHGPFGSGKTHLLRAAAQAVEAAADGRRALYFNADRYRAEFVKSLSARWASDFKDGVASVDFLFVDDLHLLGGSPKTSQELYLAINEILSEGGRVIVAADRPLEKLDELEPRLRARLQGAVSCTLTKPDLPLRRRILERMAQRLSSSRGVEMPAEVFDFIASAVPGTPRELEAALGTVVTKTVLIDQPLTRESAREALMEMSNGVTRRVSVEDIQKAVAAHHGLKVSDLLSKRRTRDIVRPRQQAMFLCKEFTSRSLPDIAKRFGGMDHTTVMHAVKRIKQLFADDPSVRADIEDLRRSLRQRGGDRSSLQ